MTFHSCRMILLLSAKRLHPGCVNAAGNLRQKRQATAGTKFTKSGGSFLAGPCKETKSKGNGNFGLSHYRARQTRYSRCADNGFLEECISAGGEKATESRKCETAAIACAEEDGAFPLKKQTKANKVGFFLKAKKFLTGLLLPF